MGISNEELLRRLQAIDVYEFEKLVADLWGEFGWETTVTQVSNDRGVDVVAEKFQPVYQKQLIQAKRYSSNTTVGSQDIQQYSSLKHQKDDVNSVVVVTTGEFTNPAKEAVNNIDHMNIVDGPTLVSMINRLESDIVSKYIDIADKIGSANAKVQYFHDVDEGVKYLSKDEKLIGNVRLNGDSLGYEVISQILDSYYNVHAFSPDNSQFDTDNELKIKKTAAELDLNVLTSEGPDIHVAKEGDKYPEVHKMKKIMNRFLLDIYSASFDEVCIMIQKYK